MRRTEGTSLETTVNSWLIASISSVKHCKIITKTSTLSSTAALSLLPSRWKVFSSGTTCLQNPPRTHQARRTALEPANRGVSTGRGANAAVRSDCADAGTVGACVRGTLVIGDNGHGTRAARWHASLKR
jgi:hypothetical protein